MTQTLRSHAALLRQLKFECVFVPESTTSLPHSYFTRQHPLPRQHSAGKGVTAMLHDGSGWSRWSNLTVREQLLLRCSGFKDNTERVLAHFATVH